MAWRLLSHGKIDAAAVPPALLKTGTQDMSIDVVTGAGWAVPIAGPVTSAPMSGNAQPTQGVDTTVGVTAAASDAQERKPSPPFIKVPTTPLTPTVLAELVGRQPPLRNVVAD